MKVTFVTKGGITDFMSNGSKEDFSSDAVIFGFNGMGVVSYKKELDGKDGKLADLARLSKELGCVAISGCDTDTFGVFRRSVAVADRGRLLGVSDCLSEPEECEFRCGVGSNVYNTSKGKMGIIVDKDVYDMSLFKKTSSEEADAVFCVIKKVENHLPEVMLRAGSVYGGLSSAICSGGFYTVSDAKGEIIRSGSSPYGRCEIPVNRSYVVMTCKKRSAVF